MSPRSTPRPVLALAIGDPAGIGPELAARVLADAEVRAAADLIVVGDRRVLDHGAQVAGLTLDLPVVGSAEEAARHGTAMVDLGHLDPDTIPLGHATRAGGAFALENFRTCLELAAAGRAEAVCFTPFNKAAMRMAHPAYDDEISYGTEILGRRGPASEFNVLDRLWNARVTSHVPLKDVAARITREAVLNGLRLTHRSLAEAGFDPPRIAVAGLNPHAGDGGNFGREEIEVIGPAVEAARAEGIGAEGPFPPDTVFVRATKGAFDAVLTMYHDQGQIAMKLIGFDRGVTLLGGFDFPICTPAHGSAYDIAGRGVAHVGASKAALLLAAAMAGRRRVAAAA
ncbi:4-hydroxythreonine-4-phosphate dehydrogenase PdxA [Methylobacterium sp. NEAU 140]|uniref:4-hydroxythreonine-4-phosphate dehydrogenase PdxA n=1 Tax=Methylobacterium sp. NEAU 140 TaxID=3064945 RepID=UPI0027372A8E|nr:4-hydroxythreonine-4-phosphate dehydrogenase PdxA [Methylobacterium sp. NEAU 140]MDP4026862.1 4-hydroxythreonine-4-phosphate dehydrogenase PdxA [Methylobacterium sp. NEAU 140]